MVCVPASMCVRAFFLLALQAIKSKEFLGKSWEKKVSAERKRVFQKDCACVCVCLCLSLCQYVCVCVFVCVSVWVWG
jgi:hypothetical protein